jgi:hypothetical protein
VFDTASAALSLDARETPTIGRSFRCSAKPVTLGYLTKKSAGARTGVSELT